MSEQKNRLSELCLTGFILSILSPFLPLLLIVAAASSSSSVPFTLMVTAIVLVPLTGFALSIAGVATARKRGKKGKGFGIAGIILPCVYAVVAAIIAGGAGLIYFALVDDAKKAKVKGEQSVLYEIGSISKTVNEEYDISQYEITEGYDFSDADIKVSETDLAAYAKDKLQTIDKESEMFVRGKYEGFNFLIVRKDLFEAWLKEDGLGEIQTSKEGNVAFVYRVTWENSSLPYRTLELYKDPSGKFIIITNCSDYKVISEFFS